MGLTVEGMIEKCVMMKNKLLEHPQDCRSRGCLLLIILRCLAAVSSTKHPPVVCVNMPGVTRCLATLAPPSVAAGEMSQLAGVWQGGQVGSDAWVEYSPKCGVLNSIAVCDSRSVEG